MKLLLPPLTSVQLKEIRQDLDLTQREFCNKYGFSIHSWKSWESGRRMPDNGNRLLLHMIKIDPQRISRIIREILATTKTL